MCLCISERVAETWSMAEMENKVKERARPMIDEALNGGQCKPAGLLGEAIEKRRVKK